MSIRTMEPAYCSTLYLTLLTFALASSLTGVSSSAVTLSSSTPGSRPLDAQPPQTTAAVTGTETLTPPPTSPPSSIVYCQPHPDSPGSGGGNNNNGVRGRGGSSYDDKRTRGKPRSKFPPDDDDEDPDHDGNTYEREGKYWLVPPFLIGASSIVVAYAIIHCLYMHCSCSDDRRRPPPTVRRVQIATAGHHHHHHGSPPTIVLSDPEDMSGSGRTPSMAGMPRMVPMVSYDGGSYGQTQLVEAQPFLIYEPYDDLDDPPRVSPGLLQQPGQGQQRRKSALLQLPQAIGRKLSQARLSFSSVGTPYREPRASICFVPVGRTLSDPSGATNLTFAEGNQSHGVVFANAAGSPLGETPACTHSCCKVCGVSVAASSGAETPCAGAGGTEGGTTAGAVPSSPPQSLPVIVVDELEITPSRSFQASPSLSLLATDAVSNSNGGLGDADPDNH